MIPSQFYTTDYTLGTAYEFTKSISTIPISTTAFTAAYWLGYVADDVLPTTYRITTYVLSATSFALNDITASENHDIGIGFDYTSNLPGETRYNSSYYYSDASKWTNTSNDFRLMNKIDTLDYGSQGINITFAYYSDGQSDFTYRYVHFTVSEFIDFMHGDKFVGINVAGQSLDCTGTDFDDYNYLVLNVGTSEYHVFISGYRFYPSRLTYTSYYTMQHVYVNMHDQDGVQYIPFANGSLYQPGYENVSMSRSTLEFNISIPTNNQKNAIFGGFTGNFDASLLKNTSITRIHRIDGNTCMMLYNTYNAYFVRLYTCADIYHHLAISGRVFNNHVYGYDSGNVYFSELVDNQFTGNLITGDETDLSDKLSDWQKNSTAENDYTESDKPLPAPSDDEITTDRHNGENSLPIVSGIRLVSGDAFSTFYMLSAYHVAELGSLLSQAPQTFWDALGTVTDYTQANLLDYLVSLKWYPLNIISASGAIVDTVTQDIQFGFNGAAKLTFTAAGTSYKLASVNRIFEMGNITIGYRTSVQTFLDFEPYTNVTVYLPYVGTASLQCNDVIGHNINCTYIIDLTTGMCTVLLSNEYDTIYIGTGKIGVDISVSGNDILTQSEKIASSYIGASTSAVNNALSLGTAVVSGNAPGALSASVATVSDLATASIGIANAKRGIPETVGAASGFGGGYTHQTPYITVKRPAVSIPAKYGHDVGYVCNRSYTIGSLSGFTVCDNPDLTGVPATATELDMIRNILCSGFYA